jgi:hypothetical protein
MLMLKMITSQPMDLSSSRPHVLRRGVRSSHPAPRQWSCRAMLSGPPNRQLAVARLWIIPRAPRTYRWAELTRATPRRPCHLPGRYPPTLLVWEPRSITRSVLSHGHHPLVNIVHRTADGEGSGSVSAITARRGTAR